MTMDKVLLTLLLLAAVWTVITTRIMKSIIGLALTSVVLSVIMFTLNSPLAAVFELSVCAGLIPVIFITAVSFTEPLTKEQFEVRRHERFHKFRYLFIVLVIAAFIFWRLKPVFPFNLPLPQSQGPDAREFLWHLRPLDLFGQIVVLLAGAFGVVVLFKEKK